MAASHTDDAPVATAKHPEAGAPTLATWAVTINRPAAELFAYWRDFANLATFMENVVRIDVRSSVLSHWVVKAPGGRTVEWDAAVTEEQPDRLIAWASQPGADIANSGTVEFRNAGARGTIVTATIDYAPPAGIVGKVIAKMFQREPNIQVRRDLRRFKQFMETGEIATAAVTRKQFDEEMA